MAEGYRAARPGEVVEVSPEGMNPYDYTRTAMAVEAERSMEAEASGGISKADKALDRAIAEAWEVAGRLEDRLGWILRPASDQKAEGANPRIVESDLAYRLGDRVVAVEALTARLRELISRVDL